MCKLDVISQERLKIEVKGGELLLSANRKSCASIGARTDEFE